MYIFISYMQYLLSDLADIHLDYSTGVILTLCTRYLSFRVRDSEKQESGFFNLGHGVRI